MLSLPSVAGQPASAAYVGTFGAATEPSGVVGSQAGEGEGQGSEGDEGLLSEHNEQLHGESVSRRVRGWTH